jgi:hypothetical protein
LLLLVISCDEQEMKEQTEMIRRQVVFILVFIGAAVMHITAQDDVTHIWSQIDSVKQYSAAPEASGLEIAPKPWSFNTMIGTSFGYSPYFGSSMNMFAAPQASFRANERLSFHGGLVVSQTVPVLMHLSEEPFTPAGMSNISAFAAATYRLTENLTLHGAGIKSMVNLPVDINSAALDYTDLSVGATYNFGNFSIGASFHKSDKPFYSSPFGYGNSLFGSPFGRSYIPY